MSRTLVGVETRGIIRVVFTGLILTGDRKFQMVWMFIMKRGKKEANTCHHDMTVGCDVRGYDQGLMDVPR